MMFQYHAICRSRITASIIASLRRKSCSVPTESYSTRTVSSKGIKSSFHSTAPKCFDYHIAAAFSSKRQKFCPKTNVFTFNPLITYSDSRQRSLQSAAGQDAFFVAKSVACGATAVGVADGVGGYDDVGIDSSQFSQGLCQSIAQCAEKAHGTHLDPVSLMGDGYRRILEESVIPGGASTACVGLFQNTGNLSVANLGDSGFIIIRRGKVLYASSPQTHSFNCPLQLAMVPKSLWIRTRRFGGDPMIDSPDDAFISSHAVQNGDVVLFATDGVWDNLTNQEILRIVSKEMINAGAWFVDEGGIRPSKADSEATGPGFSAVIANMVVSSAKIASLNSKLDGPFAKEVQRLYPNENYRGGKVDDICVVTTIVQCI
ncbi:5-azacytidine resistance protein azr1 [Geopyxis carbonaria]|nr:5-azacytidine resistance protein azr1 [Geopyxis carbonaria]